MSKKNKEPKVNLTPAKQCRVLDSDGWVFSAQQAPAEYGDHVMLSLSASDTDYIFPSKRLALNAKWHTIEYLKSKALPFNPDDYLVVEI